MASVSNTSSIDANGESAEPMSLRNPGWAALLAWLVPGLGHFYQGRVVKGALFSASVLGLFLGGMVIGEGKVAHASTLPFAPLRSYLYDGWPFLCQSGIGVIAVPGWIERSRYVAGQGPLLAPTLYPPLAGERAARAPAITSTDVAGNQVIHPDGSAKRRYDLGFRYEVGMVYTVIAGLLNLLVVYDAYAGPLLPDPARDGRPDDDQDGDKDSPGEGSDDAKSKG